MDNWRNKGDKCNQQLPRTKYNNHYRKPHPGGRSNWHLPLWEKQFVTSVGSMSWKKFLEAKRFIYLYDNIMKWDDFAGEEAFRDAKNRFYARTHNLPCDIERFNPDLYIDKVDWDSQVDENLILDLESDFVAPDANNNHEPVVIFGDAIPDPYQHYSGYGWGDADDQMKNGMNPNNWDQWNVGDNGLWGWNGNDQKQPVRDQGWSDGKNVYWDWNWNWNDNNCYNGNMNNGPKTSRFHGDNNYHQKGRFWRNNGNRRKPTAQGYGNQRVHTSTQRTHVHP